MRALVCREYGPPEQLVIEEWDDPVPGEGQVLVDIKAAGINFFDALIVAGQYQVKLPPPFVPGGEASGIVAAVGPGVKRVKPGDRVITMSTNGGAFAEKCVVAEKSCLPLPDALDFEQGAGFAVTYATSYHAFRQSTQIRTGETVLVLGAAGGVGITAVEIARHMGARVIAAASSEEKLAFAREAGAQELVNYSNTPLRDALKELTGGQGVDVVYDPVGGDLAEQAYRSLAWHGRYLVIGFAAGDIPSFPINIALLKEASVIGVWWGTWAARHPQDSLQNMAELAALVEDGTLQPRISEHYPLADFAQAFAVITGRRARGKVILTMG